MHHKEVLDQQQKNLLSFLKEFKADFYLVGGTAIAFYLGHRKSIDFDLFSFDNFDNFELERKILNHYEVERTLIDKSGEYTILIQGVKVTFLHYPFLVKAETDLEDFIKIPQLKTLAAMKAYALGRRSKWKDYVDLYFILKSGLKLKDIIEEAVQIFGDKFNEKLLRTQLAYFEDIDYTEEVDYLPGFEVDKEEIKRYLIEVSLV